jgi:hypothetical protein
MVPVRLTPEKQRRIRAAPVGLLLLGWGLGLGPLAHAVVAHGDPVLRTGGEPGWVDHSARPSSRRRAPVELPPAHRHAPGAPEHLQLAMSPAPAMPAVALVVRRVELLREVGWQAPTLPRRRQPAVPCGP